ncbi:MAG: hypothetical protein VXZ94_03250, partial [Candidatus Thermoplasmatota archaeon]|nr:hypothetical protein [Candidatus Thermoplasmatota archaeon]
MGVEKLSNSRSFPVFSIILLICSILALSYTSPCVVAEDTSDDSLAEAGLTLIALRNDTLDTNQDGDN